MILKIETKLLDLRQLVPENFIEGYHQIENIPEFIK